MKRELTIRKAVIIAVCTTLSCVAMGQASSPSADQSSLGDYARKVHKDNGATKAKPKVFDNDNLPKNDALSVVGQPAAPAPEGDAAKASDSKSGSESKTGSESKPASDSKDAAPSAEKNAATPADKNAAKPADEEAKKQAAWKTWQEKLTAQKDQIDLASRELDVTQREYQLRAAAMYADTGNRLRNEAQWDKQDAEYKQKIADKQKAVEDAKQKLTDMQEEARKAGVPSSMIE